MLKKTNVSKLNKVQFRKIFNTERLRAGVSINTVAMKINKSYGIVRFVETGFRNPSQETRAKMEKVLVSKFKGLAKS